MSNLSLGELVSERSHLEEVEVEQCLLQDLQAWILIRTSSLLYIIHIQQKYIIGYNGHG